jgi:hypothetical protein
MKEKITVLGPAGNQNFEFDIPDECPWCNRYLVVKFITSVYIRSEGMIQTIHQCTFSACKKFLICGHRVVGQSTTRPARVDPVRTENSEIPDFVNDVSPSFVKIYRQAEQAVGFQLSDIAGPGFRKAFEFLVKDYAKSKSDGTQHNDIDHQSASAVVNNYIADSRVQAVAKRALWVGNDETHYLRVWEEKDIHDLKVLIRLTIEWIDIERQSALYIEDMPERTKSELVPA